MKFCVLKNGAKQPEIITKTIMISLNELQHAAQGDLGCAFANYDLKKLASDPSYKIGSKSVEILQKRNLMDGFGSIQGSVLDVILSLRDGSGNPVESTYEEAETEEASPAASSASDPTTSVAASSSASASVEVASVAPVASAATEVTELAGDVEATSLGDHA